MLKTTLKALLFTFVIFLLAGIISHSIGKENANITTPILEILLIIFSLGLIKFQKIDFQIKLPEFKKALKVFFISFFTVIIVLIVTQLTIKLFGGTVNKEMHPVMKVMSPLQVFLNVLILASIGEEMIFRGYLLNALKPLKHIHFGKLNLSLFISALAFAAVHLGLLRAGASPKYVGTIFVSTLVIGYLAGYFQQKYNNTAYAIITHMGANLIGLVMMILMHIASTQM